MGNGEEIRERAERRGMTVYALSKMSGVPKSNLYRIINGETQFGNVPVRQFVGIAHALGISADELYTGKPYAAAPSIDRRYRALDAEGRTLVDIALDAAEARQSEKEAAVQGA